MEFVNSKLPPSTLMLAGPPVEPCPPYRITAWSRLALPLGRTKTSAQSPGEGVVASPLPFVSPPYESS